MWSFVKLMIHLPTDLGLGMIFQMDLNLGFMIRPESANKVSGYHIQVL